MDTFKEKQELDDLFSKGDAPWQLWKRPSKGTLAAADVRAPGEDKGNRAAMEAV